MSNELASRLRALIDEWRKRAAGNGAIYASGIQECANELEALLSAHEAPQPVALKCLCGCEQAQHTYYRGGVQPVRRGYKLACCDCGLVHRLDFRIYRGRAQFRAFRDSRATAAIRAAATKRKVPS